MARVIGSALFIVVVFLVLVAVKPRPDTIALDFTTLASGYAGLLIGLGGFAITVLALLLGLEALDTDRKGELHSVTHTAAVRHVAVSLAVASVTCFVGANMLSEVSAFGASVEKSQAQVRTEFANALIAAGKSQTEVAAAELKLQAHPELHASEILGVAHPEPARLDMMDGILRSSIRRHFVLGSVVAYLASFLLLQALSFLLLIRFPHHRWIDALQNLGVLGIGGMVYIKMIHVASYGMTEKDFGGSRLLILMLLTVSALAYGFALKRTSARLADEAVLRTYTPLAPYFVSLVACLLCMIALAGTFNNLGPITGGDRFLAFFLPTIATGMLLVIQLHRQNPPSSSPVTREGA